MKKPSGRRSFLKKVGVGSVAATLAPLSVYPETTHVPPPPAGFEGKHVFNGPYTGEYLRRLAFPIGGIGAGMFCLEGNGAISHMSVRNRPEVFHEPGMFGALSIPGREKGAKILEGPSPEWKKFGQPNSGNGSGGNIFGLPRFPQVEFLPRFPFATISLSDNDLPIQAKITGWSPFIPTDADASSLPVGALEYVFKNTSSLNVEFVFSFHAKNFLRVGENKTSIKPMAQGFVLSQEGTKEKPSLKGDFAVFTDQEGTVVSHCWFRGGWFDPLTMVWDTIRKGEIKKVDPVASGAPGASLYVPLALAPGAEKTVRVMMAWYIPESDLHLGEDAKAEEKCDPASGCCQKTSDLGTPLPVSPSPNYKPWYSSAFKEVSEVASHWKNQYDALRKKSEGFARSFYASTLAPEVTEAIAANLTILKSPTVMRQYDGRLWAFEGCSDQAGCCHGSCTHVWNYAQAIPHLFPSLERSLRHTEYCENQNAEGHQTFRAALPIRPVNHGFHAAADGQLGGIMKVHREWRISGDHEWLKKMYPMVKVSMDYCIQTWDPKQKGIVEEPHHNTYDIEFWGPDGMCTSFYLGALMGMVKMGSFLKKDVGLYKKLYDSGKKYMEEELYNGEYFIQKIQVTGLNAPDPVEASRKSFGGQYSEEALALLQQEGPKYQYGNGCLSDGVLGAWIARMCGLGDILDREKVLSHLMAVHRYNLKKELSDHANPQRPTYAMDGEGGLLLCSWPKGGKLSLPFVYSDEVWTGIEYQVASHLMLMGKVEEGLDIVRTCRDRYDGRVRNPFNEYECGHWYARALSSYGLIEGLTGLHYDGVDQSLYVDSRVGDFTAFLSTAKGFGTVTVKQGKVSLDVVLGAIAVDKVYVSGKVGQLNKR